jgi:hypothetical protein
MDELHRQKWCRSIWLGCSRKISTSRLGTQLQQRPRNARSREGGSGMSPRHGDGDFAAQEIAGESAGGRGVIARGFEWDRMPTHPDHWPTARKPSVDLPITSMSPTAQARDQPHAEGLTSHFDEFADPSVGQGLVSGPYDYAFSTSDPNSLMTFRYGRFKVEQNDAWLDRGRVQYGQSRKG